MLAKPTGDRLDSVQEPAFRALLSELNLLKFDQAAIEARMPEFVATMTSICMTDDAQQRMVDELDGWVRWHRLPGYFLSYIFQAAMAQERSLTFVAACVLFSDSQTHFAEDLSLDSLENAYKTLVPVDGVGSDVSAIVDDLRARMRATYQYYRQWYSAAPSDAVNPLSENLYFDKAWRDLRGAFPDLKPMVADVETAALERVVDRCGEPADVYCRVVALRVLGLVHGGSGDFRAARAAYERAIADARAVGLDAEVGHLHRLLGHALQQGGEYENADLEFRLAFTWDNHPKLRFYQALALSELGDARARNLPPIDPAHVPPGWSDALEAYSSGRELFERQVARNVLPIGRAVQQQMFRSYADNAIQVALPAGPKDVLAAIEAFGPRYATDVVAESRAAGTLDAPSYQRYREARAVFHADLATRDDSVDDSAAFERYLHNVVAHRDERLYYTRTRNALAGSIADAQQSGAVAERVAALRIASTVFLVFNVGVSRTHVLLIDASTGTMPASAFVDMTEQQWKAAHDAYRAEVALTKGKARPAKAMIRALDGLISFYQTTFEGLFEMFLPVIAGKHLKIFPRYHMNEMPFQALRVGDRRLIDVCDVSYAPSLSLWLQIHEPDAAPAAGSLMVLHDAARTPLFSGTLRAIAPTGEAAVAVVADGSWDKFRATLAERPSTDILFACHGAFNGDDPRKSCLFVTKDEPVAFDRFFADLDLRGYRSVVMGACESGVGRTLVSAEYIGLPLALLAAGVKYAIGALWQVNKLASAILLADFYRLLHGETGSVVHALNEAERRLSVMTKTDVKTWMHTYLPESAALYESEIDAMDEPPFGHPYYWAGYYVAGDV